MFKLTAAKAAIAVALFAGMFTALPAATSPAPAQAAWGFNVLVWQHTIADPLALNRQYYYNRCKDRRGAQVFTFKTDWISTTYKCWDVLA